MTSTIILVEKKNNEWCRPKYCLRNLNKEYSVCEKYCLQIFFKTNKVASTKILVFVKHKESRLYLTGALIKVTKGVHENIVLTKVTNCVLLNICMDHNKEWHQPKYWLDKIKKINGVYQNIGFCSVQTVAFSLILVTARCISPVDAQADSCCSSGQLHYA